MHTIKINLFGCLDFWIVRVTGFQIKDSKLLVKLFIPKLYKYISYTDNNRKLQKFDYTPGSVQAVTGLYLSAPRMAGPLKHYTLFQNNSLYYQQIK
jgi:hypothetical protein